MYITGYLIKEHSEKRKDLQGNKKIKKEKNVINEIQRNHVWQLRHSWKEP